MSYAGGAPREAICCATAASCFDGQVKLCSCFAAVELLCLIGFFAQAPQQHKQPIATYRCDSAGVAARLMIRSKEKQPQQQPMKTQ